MHINIDRLQWWKKQNNETESQELGGIIRVIGDRASGKTTYMAALARWPNADPKISSVQQVQAINNDGEQLIERAKNILEQGDSFEPTPLNAQVNEIKDYCLRIVLKDEYSESKGFGNQNSALKNLNINCKDYAGEFFSDLIDRSLSSSLLQDYISDCINADGIMLLLDGMGFRQDDRYLGGIERFLEELDRIDNKYRRIAIVITKCEQPELWVNRRKPQLIVEARFPKIYQKLLDWKQLGTGDINCFTTSSFGMVGSRYYKPNMKCLNRDREGIKASVIRYPQQWKPFGLVAPIYWLCAGKRHPQLDFE